MTWAFWTVTIAAAAIFIALLVVCWEWYQAEKELKVLKFRVRMQARGLREQVKLSKQTMMENDDTLIV